MTYKSNAAKYEAVINALEVFVRDAAGLASRIQSLTADNKQLLDKIGMPKELEMKLSSGLDEYERLIHRAYAVALEMRNEQNSI